MDRLITVRTKTAARAVCWTDGDKAAMATVHTALTVAHIIDPNQASHGTEDFSGHL